MAVICGRAHWVGLAAAASLVAPGLVARAANAPLIAPAPAWVRPAPLLAAEPASFASLPLAVLLHDAQFNIDADGWTEYHELRIKAQSPLGLQALGAVPFVWSPWSDTLTFHRAVILRDGQSIDVLPRDGAFTVLRRETQLEQATLTGVLTAVLQPEGLRVGDVLDIVLSFRHADPLLKGRLGAPFVGWDISPVAKLRLQARWPSALAVHWRESAGLAPARRTEADGFTTVELDLDDVRPLTLPAHAPQRYQHGRQVEFSTFAGWSDVAGVMAPLYGKAAELEPASPLRSEIARIAQLSPRPKARAAAALRLVQEEVRYLAHVQDGGGYTPQTADETWRLRYGDCKAKTALLLALLRELGVPAEAVLASTSAGDGLDQHLPSMLWFDHVIVRVRLDGRDYWLDGAREGDTDIDQAPIPAYGWVLPLDPANARLVRLVPAPASHPLSLQIIDYDASAGVTAPAPTRLKTVFRGDGAVQLHAQLSLVPPERMDSALRAFWAGAHSAFTPAHTAATWNSDTVEETFTADGTSKLDWSGGGLELQHVGLGGAPDIKRDPAASDPDAPYVIDYPAFDETDESVILPRGGSPSTAILEAVKVDEVIASVAYRRTATVADGRVRVVATRRSLVPEISAAEARASVEPLTRLGEKVVTVPAGPLKEAAGSAAALDSHPRTVEGHIARGNALEDAGRLPEALREYDAAIALDPKSQIAWADRAVAHAWSGEDIALTDADKADYLGKPEIVAARARGLFAEETGDLAGARRAFRAALTREPNDRFSLGRQMDLDARAGDVQSARRDLDRLVRAHPDLSPKAALFAADIDLEARLPDAARRELAHAPARSAEDHLERAGLWLEIGDKARARADADAALALEPTAAAWFTRAKADADDPAAATADLKAARTLAPDDVEIAIWPVDQAVRRSDVKAAIDLLNGLDQRYPGAAGRLLLQRARLEWITGRDADAAQDLVKARALRGDGAPEPSSLCAGDVAFGAPNDIAEQDCARALAVAPGSMTARLSAAILLRRQGREPEFDTALAGIEGGRWSARALNELCYTLAIENLRLDHALTACDAALKMRPDDSPTLDSRGFVLMRIGRDAEALKAYDAALAIEPKQYTSLYGKALIEARHGQTAAAARDGAAALAGRPTLPQEFARFGVR